MLSAVEQMLLALDPDEFWTSHDRLPYKSFASPDRPFCMKSGRVIHGRDKSHARPILGTITNCSQWKGHSGRCVTHYNGHTIFLLECLDENA